MSLTNLEKLAQLTSTASNRRHVLSVAIDDVVAKKQVRTEFKDIDELADSLKTEGLQQPITVSPRNIEGKYVIQKGERRWRAAKQAGFDKVDVIVNNAELTPLDEVAGALIENIQRDDLTPMEVAHALQVFVEEGWSQSEIAKRLGKSRIYVNKHLALLRLPDPVQELYDKEIVSDQATLNNLRVVFEHDPELGQMVCDKALEAGGLTREESRDALKEAKASEGSLTDAKPKPKERESQDKDGTDKEPSTPESVSTNPDTETQPSTEWKAADPAKVVISVNVALESKIKQGVLLLDRISRDPKYVWVRVFSGKKERVIKVACADIDVCSVET